MKESTERSVLRNKGVVSALDSHDLLLRVNKSGILLNQTQLEMDLHSQDSQLILKMKDNKKTLNGGLLQHHLSHVWHRQPCKQV